MTDSFEIVGKLSLPKESEKFKPYSENTYDSGWVSRTLNLTVAADGQYHNVTIKGMKSKDESNLIYYSDTERNKKTVKFKNRYSVDLETVAPYNKQVLNLNSVNSTAVNNAVSRYNTDNIPEETLKQFGCDDYDELVKLAENCKKKRFEFLSAYDFAEKVYKLVTSGKFSEKKFLVKGTVEPRVYNGKAYIDYMVDRIYLVADDTEECGTASLEIYFASDAIEEYSNDDEKFYVNGYLKYYDKNAENKSGFAPYKLVILNDTGENADRKRKIKLQRFDNKDDEALKVLGVVVNMLNGTQRRKIRIEDLSDEQQDAISCGDITLEEINREAGGMFGQRVTEHQYKKLRVGYSSGAQDTNYTVEDLVQAESKKSSKVEADDDDDFEDIF